MYGFAVCLSYLFDFLASDHSYLSFLASDHCCVVPTLQYLSSLHCI